MVQTFRKDGISIPEEYFMNINQKERETWDVHEYNADDTSFNAVIVDTTITTFHTYNYMWHWKNVDRITTDQGYMY